MKKLNRRSKQTSLGSADDDAKRDYEKKIRDLESENEAFKQEIEELKFKMANISPSPGVGIQNLKEDNPPRSSAAKELVMSLKDKPNLHSYSRQKYKSEKAAAQFNEVQKLKAQKVKLQCKIKLDSVQFRLCKASLKKDILQLKKEQRKREFEIRILLALNRRQKLMLQRKKTEAFAAIKRLRQLVESTKTSSHKTRGPGKGNNTRIQDTKHELEVTTRLHELHYDYERQMEEIAEEIKKFRLEADMFKADMKKEENSCSLSQDSQMDNTPLESDLKELKEEFTRLSTLVSQMDMTKLQLSELDKSQMDPVQSSGSSGNNVNPSIMESSPSENSQPSPSELSQGTISTTKDTKTEVCCSCTKRSLCKTYKCECKAIRSNCGASCGCTTSRCTNREASIKSDIAIQSENAEENAAYSDAAEKQRQKPTETNDDSDEPRKQPLRDIGNAPIKPFVGKAGRQRKQLKPFALHVNANPTLPASK